MKRLALTATSPSSMFLSGPMREMSPHLVPPHDAYLRLAELYAKAARLRVTFETGNACKGECPGRSSSIARVQSKPKIEKQFSSAYVYDYYVLSVSVLMTRSCPQAINVQGLE